MAKKFKQATATAVRSAPKSAQQSQRRPQKASGPAKRNVALVPPAGPATLAERFALLEQQRRQPLKHKGSTTAAARLQVREGGVTKQKRRPAKKQRDAAGAPKIVSVRRKAPAAVGAAAAPAKAGAAKKQGKRGGARRRHAKDKKMDTA